METLFASFQAITLVCLAGALILRLTAPRQGSPALIAALTLLTVSVLLAIPSIYTVIDDQLGGFNLANLLLRLFLFGSFLLIGIALSAAYGSPAAQRAIYGRVGLLILLVATFLIVAMFAFIASQSDESSAGLLAQKQLGLDPALVYGVVGYVYPAYVAAVLLGFVWREIRGTGGSDRAVSVLVLIALIEIVALPILQGIKIELTYMSLAKLAIQYSALCLLAIAFTISNLRARRAKRPATPPAGPSLHLVR